jgi:hypothetical protein
VREGRKLVHWEKMPREEERDKGWRERSGENK